MNRRIFVPQLLAAPSFLVSSRDRLASQIVELLATAALNLDYASRLREGEKLAFYEARLRGKPAFRLAAADRPIGYILRQWKSEQIRSIRIHRTLIDPFGRRRILVAIEMVLS